MASPQVVQTQTKPPLKRNLGLWMLTALVVGNMIGSGVFLLPASLAALGSVSIFGWALTGAGAILLALVFANLGRSMPRTGGPYAYARSAFGDFVGFQTAWGYWIAVWAGNAAIAVAFVGYLGYFFPGVVANGLSAALAAIAAIWLLTLVNIAGVREGGQVQLITTILKFVPLAIIGLVGIFFIKGSNFGAFAPTGVLPGITSAAALTLWAFIGLESATVPAEEVKDPERNIPRATIIGTLLATGVYVLATIAIMGIIPSADLAKSTSPFADAAQAIFGSWAGSAIALVAMISAFGALNGWILLQGRVPLAAAQDGLFPKAFAKVHGKRGTPVFGLVVSSILVSGLMLMNYNQSLVAQFSFVILLATLTTLVPYAYSAAAQAVLWIREPERFSGRSFARDTIVATLAFAYSVWAIIGSGTDVIAKGFILLTLGIPVYVFLKWRQAITAPATKPATSTASDQAAVAA
ncbi:MAG TPA: amino acid permease [Candidatus Dormibacteraeota bacterium]